MARGGGQGVRRRSSYWVEGLTPGGLRRREQKQMIEPGFSVTHEDVEHRSGPSIDDLRHLADSVHCRLLLSGLMVDVQ